MKTLQISAVVLNFVVAINALLAGYSFMTDPSGAGLGTSVALLKYSPFEDFFIPGLVLFTVNGILSLITAAALLSGWSSRFLMLIVQGILLGGWILIQVMMLRTFNTLHFIFVSLSLFFILAGTWMHRNRR